MDKFELRIAMLKPKHKPAKLNEKQFMKKLQQVQRARRVRRMLLALMLLAAGAVIAGALRRNMSEVVSLTFRYFGELPSMFGEFFRAYTATISWPSILSLALLIVVSFVLIRARKDITASHSRRTYQYAAMMGVLALAFGIAGIFGSSAQANAQQEALKRTLNARGHLEVRVGGSDYELYGKSQASDDSIRNQATIEQIRSFDISKAYPELKNMNRDGFVAEIRAVNTKDDCIFYAERRLEPALNQVMDSNSGCIRSTQPVYYISSELRPIKAPKWAVGQAAYFSYAQKKDVTDPHRGIVGVVILLDGKADQYVARSNSEKVVPKGQPGTGVQSCGIDLQDICPNTGMIDVFTNAEGRMASGEIGSSVPGDSLRPRPGTSLVGMFGKIVALDNRQLQLETTSGKKLAISWPRNYIQDFNTEGAANYPTTTGPLKIQLGDYLSVRFYYKDGMNLQELSISEVQYIGLAIKSILPDPLSNESYNKSKASQIEKYRP